MKIKTVVANIELSVIPDPEQLSNAELIERCTQLGSVSVKARRMFMGLLPLVAHREAYNVKKFSSIYHFASMVGGVGYDLVEEILRLDRQLEELPKLRKVMYSGEIGWAKIRTVLCLVTRDNQDQWLELLKNLSKPAIEVYVHELKKQKKEEEGNLFSHIIEASCTSQENISESLLRLKSATFERPIFPGEKVELENKTNTSKTTDENESDEDELTTSNRGIKEAELTSKRETLSFSVNQWLAAQLRLFRRKLEKERKKLITWQDVLAELLERAT